MPLLRSAVAVPALASLALLSPALVAPVLASDSAPALVDRPAQKVTYSASADTARARIEYTCADAPGQVHYLVLRLSQGDRPAYVAGYRGDTGGTVRATCTGEPVEQVVTLARTSYEDPARAGLHRGVATLTTTLTPRATADNGGWYVSTGDDASRIDTVRVKATR